MNLEHTGAGIFIPIYAIILESACCSSAIKRTLTLTSASPVIQDEDLSSPLGFPGSIHSSFVNVNSMGGSHHIPHPEFR